MLEVLMAWQFWTVIGAYAVFFGTVALIAHMRDKGRW